MSDLDNLKRIRGLFLLFLFFSVGEILRTVGVKSSGLYLGGQMELSSPPVHSGHSLTLTHSGPFPCVFPQIIFIFLQDYCLGLSIVA